MVLFESGQDSQVSNLEPNVADANVRYQAVQIDHEVSHDDDHVQVPTDKNTNTQSNLRSEFDEFKMEHESTSSSCSSSVRPSQHSVIRRRW